MSLDNYLVVRGKDIDTCRLNTVGKGRRGESKEQAHTQGFYQFHVRDDKCAHRPIPYLSAPTVDSCDTLSSWLRETEMAGSSATVEISTGAYTVPLEFS